MWAHKRPGSAAGGPQKKLTIRGIQSVPTLPANYKADTLTRLQRAVQAIQSSQPTPHGLEELYRDCESLCLHKFGSDIYAMIQAELESYVKQQLSAISNAAGPSETGPTQDSVLSRMRNFWTGYVEQLGMIRCVFLYLDRTYVLQTANVASLWAMGLSVVRRYLIDTDLKTKVIRLLIAEVTNERNGMVVDRPVLLSLVNMFVELGMYLPFFMPSLVAATREYYQKESRRLLGGLVPITPGAKKPADNTLDEMDVPRYLEHVLRRVDEESTRCDNYLGAQSKSALLATTRSELVEKHTERLLSNSFDAMASAHMLPELSNMYSLLNAVDRLGVLKKAWAAYIKKTGMVMVQAPDLDVSLVTELLSFKQRLDAIITTSFSNNPAFVYALREAFGDFINTKRNKPSQLIARFIDQCMRSGGKMASEEDLDELLDRVLVLFRYIQGKDLFEAFYKRDLAKRLLYNKSASMDAERSMLQKLKLECGAGFTNRLEGMYRDMEVSEDINSKFLVSQKDKDCNVTDIGFHTNVLTLAFWPTYEPMKLVAPQQVQKVQDAFVDFYTFKHQGRNLQWQNNLSTCSLKVHFDDGTKELLLSGVQGTLMLLFVDNDELSYTEIRDRTGLEDIELQRSLQSLACGKYRVLTKEPKGRDVTVSDKFIFNSQFKCPLTRIKISQILVKEDETEDKNVEEHVQQDRLLNIDAAFIRIMKARKTLEHSALMTELVSQLRFSTSSTEAKERLESLIDRDYIKRDDADQSIYHYLA
ncbi:hypothetical protein GGI07_001377 [Coemansia sp. Benny D115]|nr:hypothetical protein GGI07_001377 [Coemansia sp. Benny D115]